MRRPPIANIPRGPRRDPDIARQNTAILGYPRQCPMWEIQAVRALIKPQFKEAIAHRASAQRWSAVDAKRIEKTYRDVRERLSARSAASARHLPAMHFPRAGEYHLIATFDLRRQTLARLLAVEFSKTLPGRWLVVGKLFAHDGKLYRRRGLRRWEIIVHNARWPAMLRDILDRNEATSTTN